MPFNIFGGEGSITQAMLDYVAFTQRDSSRQQLWDFSANLTGGLFDLPGGPAGIAIGVEHRDLTGRFDPDPIVAAGLGSDIPALPTAGGYNVDEAYAELRLPLLRDTPFFHRLELTGAARYSDYSTSGSTTTFSAGINWEPIEDLLFRGSWAEGFRAPSIGELFGTPSRFDQEVVDPCSRLDRGRLRPTVRANCVAEGVPPTAAYTQLNAQLPVVTGGNRDLDPETCGKLGLRRGLAAELRCRASRSRPIITTSRSTARSRRSTPRPCSAAAPDRRRAELRRDRPLGVGPGHPDPRPPAEHRPHRDRRPRPHLQPTAPARPAPARSASIWTNTFLFNYHVTVPATVGVTVIDREGTEQGSPDQAFPKFKSTGIIDWTLGQFGASLTGRYISGVEEGNGNELGSRFYTDVQLRWNPDWLGEGLGFAIGANNLFNVDPPPCFTCGLNNMDPTTYDVPGTFFYGRITFRM